MKMMRAETQQKPKRPPTTACQESALGCPKSMLRAPTHRPMLTMRKPKMNQSKREVMLMRLIPSYENENPSSGVGLRNLLGSQGHAVAQLLQTTDMMLLDPTSIQLVEVINPQVGVRCLRA